MAHCNTVLNQILNIVPRHEFEQLANQHHTGRSFRKASRWSQFVAMTIGQLSGRCSLRDIVENLAAQSHRLYHVGSRDLKRTTLARINEDKPYNQFVKEQVAGDEMDPDNPENLVATGFLRMGPWEQTGMSVFKETRQMWLDDVTDSVGQTFLAHAMQCAKCHDHKFDPVPTRDYYGMMAVFSTTQFAERTAPFLASESKHGFAGFQSLIQSKIAGYERQKKELAQKIARLKKAETGNAKVGDNGLDPGTRPRSHASSRI